MRGDSLLARLGIQDWEGVGDGDGERVPLSPEGVDALLDLWPMTANELSQSDGGKAVAPHDHSFGRPSAVCVDPGAETCLCLPPAPCVQAMENSAPTSVRTVLQAPLNVDIDDANSVEAFRNRRRRDADLHRLMEKAISDTAWGGCQGGGRGDDRARHPAHQGDPRLVRQALGPAAFPLQMT